MKYFKFYLSIWLFIIAFLLCGLSGFAQEGRVTGIVIDSKGESIIGATVSVKGDSNGTITDLDGRFSVELDGESNVLVISYIGYLTQEVKVRNHENVVITLQEDVKTLDEVVVVGYGTQKKSELTAAISSVKSNDFIKGNVKDAASLLKGKIAGLTIVNSTGDPTENSSILLRGTNSLQGNNSPLILIDGIPGDLRTVAPEDIAQIDVLKDGSSAAIYGTRATNGVILITTRKADSDFSIDYSGYVGTEQFVKTEDLLNADDFRSLIKDGTISATDFGGDTNWIEAITRTPINHGHNLSMKGGEGDNKLFVKCELQK